MSQAARVQLTNVSKSFTGPNGPVTLLRNLTFCARAGDRICIYGVSGSGKSSLLEILGTLSSPDTGQVTIGGKSIFPGGSSVRLWARRHIVSTVFQQANLIDHLSAVDNVALPLKYRGVRLRLRQQAAEHWLNQVGLAAKRNDPASRLSGGERQRVAIARAMVTDPQVLLADEPTGSLDRDTGHRVLTQMMDLTDQGRTLIMVTHDLSHKRFFDHAFELQKGQLSQAQSDARH